MQLKWYKYKCNNARGRIPLLSSANAILIRRQQNEILGIRDSINRFFFIYSFVNLDSSFIAFIRFFVCIFSWFFCEY